MKKTFLAQNKFTDSAAPAVGCEAVAKLLPPLSGDGQSVSPGDLRGLCHSGEIEPSAMLAWAPGEPEAVVRRAAASDNFENDLERLIGVAGKRRRLKLPRFVPDYEGLEAAINDPGAPRLRADDPVWTDASPLFLREA